LTNNETTFSGNVTDNQTNQTVNLKSDFNPKDHNDNPFSYFPTAIQAVYSWIGGGALIQNDQFEFWAVKIIVLIASIFLIILLQNMLIGFMT
jgi:hypothetical protein